MSCGQIGSVRELFLGLAVVAFTILYLEFHKLAMTKPGFNQPRKAIESSWTSTQKAVEFPLTFTEKNVSSSKTSTQKDIGSSRNSTKKTVGSLISTSQYVANLSWITTSTVKQTPMPNSSETEFPNEKTKDSQRPPIFILLWRPLYKDVKDVEGHMAQQCPKHNCHFTSDRKYMPEADAVVIEVEGFYNLPPKTKMGQVWIYADMESPAYMGNGIKSWNNLFNWTMTYRRDSDTPHFYGSLTKKVKAVDHALFNRKTRSMLWMVSNCHTAGKRELFVKQLQKYTPVDVIGRCGIHICPKGNKHCQLLLMNNYKFLFAAENSNCRDYVTEKAYRSYGNFILPVVRGGGNYSLYFPPKSHINTGDFVSQTFVGNYEYLRNNLNYFDVNKEIYQSYISVIKQYKADILDVPMGVAFCKLCDKLNNQSKYRRLYRNIHDWWRGHEQTSGYFCEKDELARL